MTKLLPPMEADPFYWKCPKYKFIEDCKKSPRKKSKLLPPDWG